MRHFFFLSAHLPPPPPPIRSFAGLQMAARNRALEGDTVAIVICPRQEWRPLEIDAENAGLASYDSEKKEEKKRKKK
jgi:hypothetical protein